MIELLKLRFMWKVLNLCKVYLPPFDMYAIVYSDILQFLAP